jgi:acetyl esterase/lipase
MTRTRHLVDLELLEALDQSPSLPLRAESLAQIRADRAAQTREQLALEPPFPDIEVAERRAPGPDGAPDVRVLVYRPRSTNAQLPALVWIHGGGYVLGTPEGEDLEMKLLVSEVGCMVISVDYRLAPECPFPAGLDDCYAVLRWAYAESEALGLNRAQIAIGGSSAGGGLAAALALQARDRAEVPVMFQVLRVPMLDDRTAALDEPHPYTGEFTWTHTNNLFGWTALLGVAPGSPGVSAYAAPARAESLAGLPAAFISTGALDLFLEEDMEYARRLMREGVPTELHVYPGAYHGFTRAAQARVTLAARRDYVGALQRAFELAAARAEVAVG